MWVVVAVTAVPVAVQEARETGRAILVVDDSLGAGMARVGIQEAREAVQGSAGVLVAMAAGMVLWVAMVVRAAGCPGTGR